MLKNRKKSKYIKEIIELHYKIDNNIEKSNLDVALRLVDELGGICKTENYYVSLSTIYFIQNKTVDAKHLIDEGLLKYPFSYSLQYNASIIEYLSGNYEKSFYSVGKSLRYASSSKQIEEAEENLNGLIQNVKQLGNMTVEKLRNQLKKVQEISNEKDQRIYPLDQYGKSMIRKVREISTGEQVMVNMYKSYKFDDIEESNRALIKTELVKGESSTCKTIILKNKSAIPISFIDEVSTVFIKHNDDNLIFNPGTLNYKQFNYLTFDEGTIEIKSDASLFIGTPIPLETEKKPYRLVLHLFIDGLSQNYLRDVKLKNVMPNTDAFFREGYINENTNATSEWTLPSLASICTGKYTVEHGLYHPNYVYNLSDKNKLLLTHIKAAGYYTSHFNNDWRSVPNYGYEQAFDRILYQNAVEGYGASEIIGEAIEHIETFKDNNNYVWITLTDLHDIPDEINKNIMGQVSLDAKKRTNKDLGVTSVRTSFNENKTTRYYHELKRLDLHLATLYRYLKATYKEDEILIILNSDHGQSFLAESQHNFMHDYRRKVPLMMYGKGIKQSISDKLTSNVDLYPTILHLLGIKGDGWKELDGQIMEDFDGPKREYSLTESYHPGQTYKAVIETEDFILYFETLDFVDNFGKVDLIEYKVDITIKNEKISNEELEYMVSEYEVFIIKKRAILQR